MRTTYCKVMLCWVATVAWCTAIARAQLNPPAMSAEEEAGRLHVRHVGLVAPDVLAVALRAGRIEHGSQQPYQNQDGFELDFSQVREPGEYVVAVEGVGCSYPFSISKRRLARCVHRWRFKVPAGARAGLPNRPGSQPGKSLLHDVGGVLGYLLVPADERVHCPEPDGRNGVRLGLSDGCFTHVTPPNPAVLG